MTIIKKMHIEKRCRFKNRSLKKEINSLKEEIRTLKIETSVKVPFSHSKDAEVKLSKEEYIAKIGELYGI